MNKRGSVELMILGLIAVIAVVGLVLLFKGATGQAAGDAMTRQVLVNEEEFRIERPGGYSCECTAACVYDGQQVRSEMPITAKRPDAEDNCEQSLKSKCAPQPIQNFKFNCVMR